MYDEWVRKLVSFYTDDNVPDQTIEYIVDKLQFISDAISEVNNSGVHILRSTQLTAYIVFEELLKLGFNVKLKASNELRDFSGKEMK